MRTTRIALFFALVLGIFHPAMAQRGESYRGLLTARVRAQKLPAPAHLQAYIQDGKLRLSLRDAILLTLENDSAIQIQETSIESQKFNLLSSYQLFDPSLQGNLNINRSSSPGYTQLQGVGTSQNSILNTLSQSGQINWVETFTPGTNIDVGISAVRSSTNSGFLFFNPYVSSSLNFQFTQPLLRNAGRFANTAYILIGRKDVAESREHFAAQVNAAVLQVVNQYWNTVAARETLTVQQKAQQLADESYQRDKRALELGALPPLDISRSQAEVAARKVAVIQAAYALDQAEETLRFTIGVDQDPRYSKLPFELTERPEPLDHLEDIDAEAALDKAIAGRPEVAATQDALDADQLSIRYAHNQLKPLLTLSGNYQSSGLGGNQYDLVTGSLISAGGFGSSFNQLFGFSYPTYGGTLSLNFPVRNRAGQAELGNALVAKTRDLYNQRQTVEQITQQVRTAADELNTAKQALAAAVVSVDLAKKTLAADERKFELGAETNYFVLDSQERLAQAELILLQSQISYQVAVASVHYATGDLIAPYRIQIDAASR
ncbi:MAG: TolC family protein [Acidobacteriota bacterium]